METAGVWDTQLSITMNGMIFNASITLDQSYLFLFCVKVSNSSFVLRLFCIFLITYLTDQKIENWSS